MKLKKTLTAVVAVALVAAVSVAGTLAYLSKSTGPVTNTFTAGSLGKNMALELKETPVQQGTDGQYTLTSEPPVAQGQKYENVLPGSTNAKDPHVNVTGLTTDAYLFVEVVNNDPNIIAEVDSTNWTEVPGAVAKTEGAKVYMYKADGKVATGTDLNKVYVLKNNQFKVSDKLTGDVTFQDIVVKSYICQAAGFTNAADAWAKAF